MSYKLSFPNREINLYLDDVQFDVLKAFVEEINSFSKKISNGAFEVDCDLDSHYWSLAIHKFDVIRSCLKLCPELINRLPDDSKLYVLRFYSELVH